MKSIRKVGAYIEKHWVLLTSGSKYIIRLANWSFRHKYNTIQVQILYNSGKNTIQRWHKYNTLSRQYDTEAMVIQYRYKKVMHISICKSKIPLYQTYTRKCVGLTKGCEIILENKCFANNINASNTSPFQSKCTNTPEFNRLKLTSKL